MSTQPIRFFHRGKVVEVGAARTTRTVLDWLREDAHCTGTKEGCNEGDCGACTVVIGELGAATGSSAPDGLNPDGLKLHTVNACIQFLPTLNGKALFTIEDLKPMAGGRLHPAQQAMVECHGSQCGFCTPGFVMSLWHTYERHQAPCGHASRPTRQQLADDLAGNLCRCTGYRPILDAGQRMFDLPAALLDRQPVVDALAAIRPTRPFHYAAPGLQPGDGGEGGTVDNGGKEGKGGNSRDGRDGAARIDHYHAPSTVDELAILCEQKPSARLLAGCTDIGLWVNKQLRDVGDLIHVGNVAQLKRIQEENGHLCIGAGASLEAAWAALARRFEGLTDVWLRFGSPPIRNAGTMGGNVANGSPIGDAPPVLMALDARVELRKGDVVRQLPLTDFYLGYMKNRLLPGEFLQRLLVPLWPAPAPHGPRSSRHLRVYKISKRFDSDISAVCAAFAVQLDGDTVQSIRLAFGGMAGVVRRAAGAEAALAARPWTREAIDEAKAALAQDFEPLSDMRASSGYRMQVAQNLLQKFWLETRSVDALPPQATSVWSVMPHDPSIRA